MQSKQYVTSDEKLDDAQEGQMHSDTSSESDDQVLLEKKTILCFLLYLSKSN